MRKLLIACMLFMSSTPVFAGFSESQFQKHVHRADPYITHYEAAAKKHGVPMKLLLRQSAIESGFWDKSIVTGKRKSKRGAIGIGQFMPATARMFGINPYDVQSSINGQALYMKTLYDKFGSWELALCAYNWGDSNLIEAKLKAPKAVLRYARFILGTK